MRHATLLALSTAVLSALLLPAVASASPCEMPGAYVQDVASDHAPLRRPYLIDGMAATALHRDADGRWLELAVDSATSARRLLAEHHPLAAVRQDERRTLVRCDSLGTPALASR